MELNRMTESCVQKKRDWPWKKLAAQFVTKVRDPVLLCHGRVPSSQHGEKLEEERNS